MKDSKVCDRTSYARSLHKVQIKQRSLLQELLVMYKLEALPNIPDRYRGVSQETHINIVLHCVVPVREDFSLPLE